MKLIVYPLLSRKSKRAIARKKKRFGKPYDYQPRRNLIYRLTRQLNMTEQAVRRQIEEERAYILKYPQYFS